MVSSPVAIVRTSAIPPCHPRTHAPVTDRPPARAKRARSGPSAALWNSPPATTDAAVRIVTSCPCSTRWSAVPSPRQSPTSSSTRTRGPGSTDPSSTSSIDAAAPASTPGSRSTIGSARWNPVRGGRDPVARITSSAPAPATSATPTSAPSRTSTPSASRRRAYHARSSVIWSREGWSPARRNWPPNRAPRSMRVTRCPRSAATRAASSPAGPPPTTSTRRGSGLASNRSPPHAHSRPADGFTRHEIQ